MFHHFEFVINSHHDCCQIDGSTLKTLCMQHGPLQSFHLYLNHSIALAKYSTREEANKVISFRPMAA